MDYIVPIASFASAGLVVAGGLEIKSKLKWGIICTLICLLFLFSFHGYQNNVLVTIMFFSIWVGGDLGIHLNNDYPKLKFKKKSN